jgi:hypothetical protein
MNTLWLADHLQSGHLFESYYRNIFNDYLSIPFSKGSNVEIIYVAVINLGNAFHLYVCGMPTHLIWLTMIIFLFCTCFSLSMLIVIYLFTRGISKVP